jgi:hypothetical protein
VDGFGDGGGVIDDGCKGVAIDAAGESGGGGGGVGGGCGCG